MTDSILTELALRSGVLTSAKDYTPGTSNQPEQIKSAALKRVGQLVGGNINFSNLASQMDIQAMAINLAVQGLEISYMAIQKQIGKLKEKRLSFDKEREAGVTTFIIPTDKEESRLSHEEQIIKSFMDMVNKYPLFRNYLGIHTGTLSEKKEATFYSVLPFYKMSDALSQPVASTRFIDKTRIAISLFLKSPLPRAIRGIDIDFQDDNAVAEFFKSAVKKDNYLNDLRAPRFIMMCLANLLWNLQHPVDPETGFPISTDRIIEICQQVEQFLNKLLNKNGPANIHKLNSSRIQILSFIRKVENHTKHLRAAYTEEQLYELNINDLTNSAHSTLRIMDRSLFELIYSRMNPITHKLEPDSSAAEELAYDISYMNQLLDFNEDLPKFFLGYGKEGQEFPFLNPEPTTIIDILILFVHCTHKQKQEIIGKIRGSANDNAIEFATTLEDFDTKFMAPIKAISKKELKSSVIHKKSQEAAILTGQRLIPFITLVTEDYRVEVDTHKSRDLAQQSVDKKLEKKNILAKDQVTAINKSALSGTGYYSLKISPFVELEKDTENELDNLPQHQYRFTELTKLLDAVSEIVQNYRSFLQIPAFQQFLIKCLEKVREEYNALAHHIEKVDKCLSHDKSMNRNLLSILGPMTKNLSSSLESFATAAANFEHVVSSPDFTEQQRQLLSTKLESIHQQFMSLFNEDSGILKLGMKAICSTEENLKPELVKAPTYKKLPEVPKKPSDVEKSTKDNTSKDTLEDKPVTKPEVLAANQAPNLNTQQVLALHKLISNCINGLSPLSRNGDKGRLLNNLLQLVANKEIISTQQVTTIILELARISLSYRPTYFFQAAYAQTRAAKVLIEGIQDKELNKILPLASILLNKESIGSEPSDKDIILQLQKMKDTNKWEESVNLVTPLPAL